MTFKEYVISRVGTKDFNDISIKITCMEMVQFVDDYCRSQGKVFSYKEKFPGVYRPLCEVDKLNPPPGTPINYKSDEHSSKHIKG